VDGSFFSLFSFQIARGEGSSLSRANTAALSISKARAYFRSTEVVGKTITVNNQFGKQTYEIAAVYRNMPANSDLQYDLLLSLKTLENKSNLNGNTWAALDGFDNEFVETYLEVRPGKHTSTNTSSLAKKLSVAVKARQHDKLTLTVLQPLAFMHLSENLSDSHATYGNVKLVWLISAIGVLILIIAWFNFVNLSSAQNIKRGKEIGIRKLIGAGKNHIIRQYLIECLLLFTGSLVMAILVCIVLQPYYNRLIDRHLSLSDLLSRGFIGYFTLMFACGSIFASVYGSVSLASFKPAETLKGKVSDPFRSKIVNNTLVVFQFSLAIILITAALVLSRQLTFMENKDLGMDLEHLIVITAPQVLGNDKTPSTQRASFNNRLRQLPFITTFCSSGSVPGNFYNFNTSGIVRPNSQPSDLKKTYAMTFADSRYFDTYGIAFTAGHNFTQSDCDADYEKSQKVIVNESAAHSLGFTNANEALGKTIDWGKHFEITGVIKDYNHQSLKTLIGPVIFLPRTYSDYFTIKTNFSNLEAKIAKRKTLYQTTFPGNPFEVSFENEAYHKQYRDEKRYSTLFLIASALAIFIASLGLLGLSIFSANNRLKEIGVRKVLGASVLNIVRLLNREFIFLVILAAVIGVPIAWIASNYWLQNFAYHIELNVLILFPSLLIPVLIAFFTITTQTLGAAISNPVKNLRND